MTKQEGIFNLTVNWFENISPNLTKQQATSEAELYLEALHSQGAVIKVEEKLPQPQLNKLPHNSDKWLVCGFVQKDMLKAGYTLTAPIREKK